MEQPIWSLGLMSGTSLDGIDAAIISTDGQRVHEFGPGLTVPYKRALREKIRASLGKDHRDPALEKELTELHALVVQKLLRKFKGKVDLIGFHGQTVFHAPPRTLQLGDGQLLANLTQIPVVYDFRFQDCAAGGQGAPLVPIFHQALCHGEEHPLAVLNIGGVANVTYINGDELIAMDTGPGNALIDDYMRREFKQAYDLNGKAASLGRVSTDLLFKWLEDPFFAKGYPKSLDRNHFAHLSEGLRGMDGLATLTAFTAFCVFRALSVFPQSPSKLILCGGGRKNQTIVKWLQKLLKEIKIIDADTLGWDGDLLEAQAFAFLAARSRQGFPLSFPLTTGVKKPQIGGVHVAPKK